MENFANDFATTLSAAVTSAAVSLTVTSASGAPAPNFRVRIDNELILVTAATGTTWTVTRGIEGTTAAAHAAGAAVVCVLTAGVLAALRDHVQDIAHGGTGGTTAAEARTALGIANHEKVTVDASGNIAVTGSGAFGGRLTATGDVLHLNAGATLGAGYGGVIEGRGVTGKGGNLRLGVMDNGAISYAITILDNSQAVEIAAPLRGSSTAEFAGSGTFGGSVFSSGQLMRVHSGSAEAKVMALNNAGGVALTMAVNGDYGLSVWSGANGESFQRTALLFKAADSSAIFAGSGTFGGNILPATDNTLTCGTASYRLKEFFAGNNVINTSDARVKTTPRKMTDAEIAAAADLAENIGIFQYLDAVAEKGEAAREHAGMTVQSAIAIMEAHGLDPHRYGFICHDEWDELTEEVEDPAGDIVRVTERQVTRTEQQDYSEIKIVDGTPTLVTGTRDVQVPVTKMVEVVDESGAAVLQRVPAEIVHHKAVTDADGNVTDEAYDEVVREAYDAPLMHPVPVMEKVETRYSRKVTREAGDLYSFRTEQLNLFIVRGLAAKLSAVETGK